MNRIKGFSAWHWLAAGTLLVFPCLAHGQQQQFGTPPNTYVTWGTNNRNSVVDVTYFVGGGLNANEVNLINAAATQWSQAGSNVRLVLAGPGADITFSMSDLGNTGHLSNATFPLPGVRNPVLQIGTTLNGQPWSQIQSQENFTINSFYPWWDNTVIPAQGASYDFLSEVLDLWGYGIGLGFVTAGTQPNSVMQPNFTAGVPGNHTLSPSDISALQAVYGSPEPSTLVLLGVGLGLLGVSRKRTRRKSNPEP